MKNFNKLEPSTFPRILFLTSSAFNNVTGGGITFTNLFNGWPSNSIATVHNDTVPVKSNVCNHYFSLSEREIHRWGWFRYIPLGRRSNEISVGSFSKPQTGSLYRILRQIKTWLFGDGIPQGTVLTTELEDWILNFQPTLLFTLLGSNEMMELAEKLRVRFDLPLVVHIMDDWPSVIYRGGLFSPLQRLKKDRLIQHLMQVAVARFAICQEMAEAYEIRYKVQFQWFHNAIDVFLWHRFAKNSLTVGIPIRVAYIGTILPFAQLESLLDCCSAIQSLNNEGLQIQMEIYSPQYAVDEFRERLVVGNAITLKDTIFEDEIFFQTLQAVDILVLPVNFDLYTIKYIRYSMPTKVPAYLTVGTPILAYGPAEIAQISYAIKSGWGMAVTKRNMGELKSAFKRLATDEKFRSVLSTRAQQAASIHHDARVVRENFQAALVAASSIKPILAN